MNIEKIDSFILEEKNSKTLSKPFGLSSEEIQRRRINFNKASASVALEGFPISEILKKDAELFIQGEMDIATIVNNRLKEYLSNKNR